MSSIDERIVEMKFNNGQFQKGVSDTTKSLDNLKKGLNLDGAAKSLQGLDSAGKKFSLAGMASGIEGLTSKFSALSIMGVTALATIANKAVNAGMDIARSLTVAPIMDGFREYELKMGSIQTILANTSKDGTKLKHVTAALDELNTYADKTIYNFGDMTRNIGLFTNAGIGLKDATSMIKGFSNEAATSGTTSAAASNAAYQLSQSLSSGKITLETWRSLTNAGMGGKNMQTGIIEIADAMGTFEGKGVDASGAAKDFNKSLEKGWLTSEAMTNYLKIQAGDLSKEQMKTLGLSDKQITAFIKQQATAEDAATKVRTLTQLYGTIQESVGSSWAETFDLLFGDFDQATVLFTNVNKVLGEMIGSAGKARNDLLKGWNDLGGRDVAIEAISNAFDALMAILKPIGDAFTEIFPPATAKQLYDITTGIRDFTKGLIIGSEGSENLKRTFKGLFAVLDIGWMIIKGVGGVLLDLFGAVQGGGGGFLNLTGNIGDFLVSLRDAIKNGEGLTKFFEGLGKVIQIPIDLIKMLIGALTGSMSEVEGVAAVGDRVKARFEPLKALGTFLSNIWGGLIGILGKVGGLFAPLGMKFKEVFGGLGSTLADSVKNMDFNLLLDTVNTLLFGGLVLMMTKFMGNFKSGFFEGLKGLFKGGEKEGGGFLDSIKEAFGGLTDTLGAMQATLKAATLMQIAIAVGVLTASVVALSMIDSAKLAKALTAIGIMMGQLIGAMILLDAATKGGGFLKLPIIATGMILLSIAVNILASAVKKLAELNWLELAKGLSGVGIALALLAGFTQIAKMNKGMISTGIGIVLIATALKILASAVKDFAGISWADMAKGMSGVAAGLLVIAGAMNIMPKGMVAKAVGVAILGGALKILASALKDFGGMTWEEIGKGLVVLAGSLVLIAGALNIMSGAVGGAAALVLAAAALAILVPVLTSFGGMSWEEIAKGLVTLAGALVIIAGGLYLMTAALPGAAALVVAAGALAILTPVLIALGGMMWDEILRGLTMLAGALAILGVAGVLIIPALPGLLGLGAAIALVGIGALAAGVGLLAFSVGFAALAAAATVGTVAIVAMLTAIIGLIPMAMTQLGLGVIAFANVIATGGPAMVNALVTVLNSIITAIVTVAPRIVSTIIKLVFMLVDALVKNVPRLVVAGGKLIIGILNGIAANIGGIVKAALNIIENFLRGIAAGIPGVISAGADLVIKFVNSLASTIEARSGEMREAGGRLGLAIVDGMTGGLGSKIGELAGKAAQLAKGALNAAKNVLGIHSPSREFAKLGKYSTEGLANGLIKYAGLSEKAGAGVGQGALDAAKKALDINSPSKEFEKLGKYSNQGFAKGLMGSKDEVKTAYNTMKSMLKDTIKSTKEDIDKAKEKLEKLTKARKKDTAAIRKAQKALSTAKAENKSANKAYTYLTKNLKDEEMALRGLATRYDKTAEKLKNASKTLEDSKKTRDDYQKSIKDQFSDLADISKDTRLAPYVEKLSKQIADTKKFATAIQKLRDRGLNDVMYKELLAKGPEALPFVNEIIAGGKKSVKKINSLSSQLGKTANSLGNAASRELYQAGVNSAAGIVAGLKKQEKAIAKQMDRIADLMVSSMNKRLKIKSPSRVFMETGSWSVKGLVKGLEQTSGAAATAASGVGSAAVDALQKSMMSAGSLTQGNVNMTPTIRPVLDLSSIKKDSSLIGGMLKTPKLSIDTSYSKASGISVANRAMIDRMELPGSNVTTLDKPGVTFIQNNHSPKALSPIEIYRQTNNQLSAVKGK